MIWFKKAGWLYVPINVVGIAITVPAIGFMIAAYIAVNRNSHSVSDELYALFVYVTCMASGGSG